jgi:RimJ/RimL family protein N-acetyltransferase
MANNPPGDVFLTSPRFALRRLKLSDAQAGLVDWTLDALAAEMLNTPQRPWPVEAQKAYFSSFEKTPDKLLLGIFAKENQHLIGFYILKLNAGNSTFTISTLIGDVEWRGRNATAEASDAIYDYLFNTLGYVKAKANVRPQNKAMLWLMLSGAWKKEARLVKHLVVPGSDGRADVYVFGLLADDWRNHPGPNVVPVKASA